MNAAGQKLFPTWILNLFEAAVFAGEKFNGNREIGQIRERIFLRGSCVSRLSFLR